MAKTRAEKRGKYKRYQTDSSELIPRTTLYRVRKKAGLVKGRKKCRISTKQVPAADIDADIIAEKRRKSALISIMSLMENHTGVTKALQADILKVIRIHVEGEKPRHLQSLYKFYKEKKECFKSRELMTTKHHVCPKCFHLYEDAHQTTCPTPGCLSSPRYKEGSDEPVAFFVTMDVQQQIQDFFTDPKFVTALEYRFKRPVDGHLKDIQDGSLHNAQKDFLSDKFNLSITWSTDGVQVYNSSVKQLWPIQGVINELPPRQRFSKKNLLLFGLYYGTGKPEMTSFLSPFVLNMGEMYSTGFPVQPGGTGPPRTCRVIALACTMDLPALAVVKNVLQFNGQFGCSLCEYEGVTTEVGRGHTKTYPHASCSTNRTKQSIYLHANRAYETGQPEKGVKGHSIVCLLPKVDVSTHFLVDFMHGVCLGGMKKLLELWLDSPKKAAYHVGSSAKTINSRLAAIRPPTAMRRYPKDIDTHKQNYKASEYRDLILFYMLPVLNGILPNKYLHHLSLLVRGIYILCQEDISPTELQEAEVKLDLFYKLMNVHYGNGACTLNVHNIGRHLVECVRLAGPIFTHNCFFFEDVCGQLNRMVTGPRDPMQQIVDGIGRMQEFRHAVSIEDDFSDEVKELLRRDKRKLRSLSHGFKTASKANRVSLRPEVQQVLQAVVPLPKPNIESLARIEKEGVVYTKIKDHLQRHQDHFVVYDDGEGETHGVVEDIIVVSLPEYKPIHLVIIAPFASDDGTLANGVEDVVPHIYMSREKAKYPVSCGAA